MDEQGYRFGVGVLVIASLVIVIILILFFGAAPDLLAKRYQVTINFPEAPRVETDTPVRKNGVKIGRVTNVELLGVDERGEDRGVNLTLELDVKHKVRASEVARIATDSIITGDAVIEFVRAGETNRLARFDGVGGSPRDGLLDANERQIAESFLADGDYSGDGAGQVAPDPLAALLTMQDSFATMQNEFIQTAASIKQTSDQINGLATDVREVMGAGNGPFQQLAKRAEETMVNLNETLNAVEVLFSDPALRQAINTTSERLPMLINEAEGVMTQARSTLASFEGVGRAAEDTMKNVAEFTEPLGENGDKIVADALRTLNNLDALLADVRQLASKVNNSQGTVKRLLEDEELYFSLLRTLENVELLTRRAQPIVEDVRIFTDKVARDPSQAIGLRGVISGRPAGLGVK